MNAQKKKGYPFETFFFIPIPNEMRHSKKDEEEKKGKDLALSDKI